MDTLLSGITAISLVAAAVSTTIAWRVTRADRERRAARVAALASAAGVAARQTRPTPAAESAASLDASAAGIAAAAASSDRGLLRAAVPDSGSGDRQRLLIGAVASLAGVVLIVGAAWLLLARGHGPAPAAARVPLELVALGHARTDGVFSVTGVVRNPAQGTTVKALEADVRVFDAAGIMIASKSIIVDRPELAPGQEVPFTLPVGEAATAARYRVSFKSAGTMVPHVDRRVNTPAAVSQTADAR